eukprot:5442528-Amphidinium_carterae.1
MENQSRPFHIKGKGNNENGSCGSCNNVYGQTLLDTQQREKTYEVPHHKTGQTYNKGKGKNEGRGKVPMSNGPMISLPNDGNTQLCTVPSSAIASTTTITVQQCKPRYVGLTTELNSINAKLVLDNKYTQQLGNPTFITADVKCAMLALDTTTKNYLQLKLEGCKGFITNNMDKVQLHYIGNHFCTKAPIINNVDSTDNDLQHGHKFPSTVTTSLMERKNKHNKRQTRQER